MSLGNAKMGLVLAFKVFDELFKELYNHGVLPNTMSFDRDTPLGEKNVTVRLDQPEFVLRWREAGPLYTRLDLTGHIELRPQDQPEAAPELTLPLDVKVLLSLCLKERAGKAPVLTLAYDGVDGTPSFPVTEADIDALFAQPELATILDDVAIDLLTPMIAGLETIYFPQEGEEGEEPPPPPPPHDQWPTALRLLSPEIADTISAVGIFVALPGEDADPGEIPSVLPERTEFGLVYSRSFLDFVLGKAAEKQKGTKVSGAKIKDLSLKMEDHAIFIDGYAEREDELGGITEITFSGPIIPHLVRGTTHLQQDTRGVEVDIDVPWYAEALPFLAGFLFFIPGLNLLDIWLIPLAWEIDRALADAPDLVRGGIGAALGAGLSKLAEGLRINVGIEEITADSTPSHSTVEDGHLLLYAQVFVSPITETIVDATYWLKGKRFLDYTLESGRRFRASELARLVHKGKIITPGFHDVKGRYMRANPDASTRNNLLDRFAPKR